MNTKNRCENCSYCSYDIDFNGYCDNKNSVLYRHIVIDDTGCDIYDCSLFKQMLEDNNNG